MRRGIPAAVILSLLISGSARAVLAQVYTFTDSLGRTTQRRCEITRAPKALPPAHLLIDTARVRAILESDPTDVLMSLSFAESGGLTRLAILGGEGAVDTTGRAVRLLRSLLLPQGPGVAYSVRVRILGGPPLQLSTERSVYCPPQMLDVIESSREQVTVILPRGARPADGSRVHFVGELQIDAFGLVSKVTVVNSSGIQDLDDQLVQREQRRRFLPALLDGIPSPSWVRTNGVGFRP